MEIEYTRIGDYLLPNISLRESPECEEPLTKYGVMRRSFLKNHRLITYNCLLLAERLYPYLCEIQRVAEDRRQMLIADLAEHNPPDKAADGVAWAVHMAELQHTADEIILKELIYC